MQPVARVPEDLRLVHAQLAVQFGAEHRADVAGFGRLARGMVVCLVDVGLAQPMKTRHRIGQAGGGHAPGADGGTEQVHGVVAVGQPMAEEVAVERPQHQALGPASGGRNDAHIGRLQPPLAQAVQGGGTRMDLQGVHGSVRARSRCVDRKTPRALQARGRGGMMPDMANQHPHHDHDHDHDHDHGDHSDLDPMSLRVRALETVLSEKGYIDPAALDVLIDTYQTRIGPRNGARVVAKAWSDPAYRQWLEDDASAAIASLGYTGRQGEHMVAVFNTPQRHNMVVCTLCSCYPWPVLGLPPTWYKSAPYRSRVVRDPQAVLADFGVALPAGTDIRVWDSTAEVRYLVIPQRPAGTDGLDEAALAALVTRDSMIGTGLPTQPAISP